MYGRSLSQVEGYSQNSTSTMQQVSLSSQRHSGSHGKDRESRKDSLNKNKSSSHGGKALHVSKSSDRSKHHKVQGGLRACGNWSEHVSSSGKTYYYNKTSEKSQWEKPDEWNDSEAIDLKAKEKSKSSQDKGQFKVSRNSASHTSSSRSNSNTDVDRDYRNGRSKDYFDRDYRTKASTDCDYRGDIDYRDVSKLRSDHQEGHGQNPNADKDYRSYSSSNNAQNQLPSNHSATVLGSNGQALNSNKQENYLPSTGEYYDYSNWDGNRPHTEVNETPKSLDNLQLSQNSIDSDKISENGSKSSNQYSESVTSAFVRTLSTVLSSGSSNETKGNLENALQLLLNAAKTKASSDADANANASEAASTEDSNEPPVKKLCTSKEKDLSSQPMELNDVDTPVSVEAMVPEFIHLKNMQPIFDLNHLLHVQNWPSEHCEKQVYRLSEDYHKFVAEHLSDVNVQLTRARSQVRTYEVLSTLQQQRILYIRQQMSDLDRTTAAPPFT